MIDAGLLVDRLEGRFGISLTSELTGAGSDKVVSLRVNGIDAPNGFRVNISHGWRSIEASFVPDSFATGLMITLCADEMQRRNEFSILSNAFSSAGTKCIVKVDDKNVEFSKLPDGKWTRLFLTCSRLTDKSDEQHDSEEVASACLALLLSLLPTEDSEDEMYPLGHGLPEGALIRVTVNKYERRPANRAAAIAAYGLICKACGFDYESFYGEIGEGFIEIHHTTPVSRIGSNYILDPIKDLIPLCSNCHQMVHKKDPPIPIDDLHKIIFNRGKIKIP